ncbi:hypothetical protein RclHR1_20220005 [Rhizophagus clarus]|uniref:Reverse transcriptase domain-containing protein n=1 Tax=Rhizophagus clarus TaxID=94130 RepID=A0A2Z6R3H0_9GLOM|nr:hypothetical protein RclHR1_20220005 [Rhizophagus clarus]
MQVNRQLKHICRNCGQRGYFAKECQNEKVNEITKDISSTWAILKINGKGIRVIIDSGAAVSVILNNSRKKLGINKIEPSRSRFTMTNDTKVASIGKVRIILEIEDNIEIPIIVEIIDKDKEELILKNDILSKKESKIDYENKEVRIIEQGEVISIPIEYMRKVPENNEYDSEYSEEDYTDQENENESKYEEEQEQELFDINTENDAYSLPRIDELLERYKTANWFTSLDLASGYHQIEIEKEDKEKTAFTYSQGLYEWNIMPFGLKTAPATFQRLMDEILKDYIGKFVVVYLDDILIYSKNFEDYMDYIRKVLIKIRKTNMIVKLKKCKFGEKNIEFLGHIVGRDDLRPNEKNIEKIKNIKIPKNRTEIAKPLTELISKNVDFKWEEKQQEAFETLKKKLMEKPVLEQLDFEKEFILITDASGEGLGFILA